MQRALEAGVSIEDLTGVWTTALDQIAVQVAGTLHKDAPRMLREHASIRRGFERRLRKRWRPALELYEMVMVACRELGSDLHDALIDEDGPTSQHPIKLYALTLLHARACLVASEVFALLCSGHASGVQARWRTLHEIATIAVIISNNDDDLANRFLQHRQVEQWKEAQCYQENCIALGQEPFSDEEMAEFRSDYEAVLAQYGKGYERDWGWAKPLFPSAKHYPTFDDLEKLASLGHNKPYVKLSHRAIHSGASGTLDLLNLYGRGTLMLVGPSDADLAEPGHGSLIALYQATAAFLQSGPNEGNPDDLIKLKALSILLDEAGDAFAACDAEIERAIQSTSTSKNMHSGENGRSRRGKRSGN